MAGTTSDNKICVAVPNLDPNTFKPGDVRVGSTVNGFFITVFIIGSTGAPVAGSQNWLLWKEHEGQAGVAPNSTVTGTSKVRNQIIHQEKGLVGSGDGTAMAFKGVIKVPKSMRRMREGDSWAIRLNNNDSGVDTNFCLRAIFKSYF